jgi:hypothetical protein
MRRESMMAWRSRARLAIVVGILGGIAVGGYALFWSAMDGLASPACGGGGCEERLHGEISHYDSMFVTALLVGGALIVGGIVASRLLSRRLAQLPPTPLPTAVIVEPRD